MGAGGDNNVEIQPLEKRWSLRDPFDRLLQLVVLTLSLLLKERIQDADLEFDGVEGGLHRLLYLLVPAHVVEPDRGHSWGSRVLGFGPLGRGQISWSAFGQRPINNLLV